jgi:hypothetical protein
MAALLGVSATLVAEETTWVFEGVITQADPVLAPDLKSGWVLSGSFLLDPLAMEEDADLTSDRSGRLTDGVTGAELTVDLYYQVHFQALQVPGIVGFDYQNDDPEEDGRDLISWFFPMRGKLKGTDWSLRWLQIWLLDAEGKMIRTSPPPVPPAGFAWESNWFRLIFVNESGEEVYAEGSLEFFSPDLALEDADDATGWDAIVVELGNELNQRDAKIAAMTKELEEAQARVESLRRMVDLLVEERANLQEENTLLAQKAQPDNTAIEEQVANLTAEKALAEQDLEDLKSRNLALAETLSESEMKRRRLQKQLDELIAASEEPAQSPLREKVHEGIRSPDGRQTGTITVFEQPMVIEKPVLFQSTSDAQSLPPSRILPTEAERTARPGPRKFR